MFHGVGAVADENVIAGVGAAADEYVSAGVAGASAVTCGHELAETDAPSTALRLLCCRVRLGELFLKGQRVRPRRRQMCLRDVTEIPIASAAGPCGKSKKSEMVAFENSRGRLVLFLSF